MEDKIFNSSFNNVEYGTERVSRQEIAIDPAVADLYKENVSDDMEEVYADKRMMYRMSDIYEKSEFYEKYGQSPKRIDRGDILRMYYYFKDEIKKDKEYNIVQIFCAICEFFSLNYKMVYRDVLTLEDKVEILDTIEEKFGLDKPLQNSKKLF